MHIFLVDDHAAFREPLGFMLNREPDIEIVGQVGTLADARRMIEDGGAISCDLVIVDLHLPDGNGIDLIREIHGRNAGPAIVVLTSDASRKQKAEAVEAGAAVVLHKSTGLTEIIDVIRRVGAGEDVMSPRETIELLRLATGVREHDREAQAAIDSLTPRELDVIRALAEGLSDREIAQKLMISPGTARTHMVNILAKLGVDSRVRALVFAVRYGLVTLKDVEDTTF